MQNINLNIKVDKNKITIEFKPSSLKTVTIQCTEKQLLKHYKLTVEQLSPTLIRHIIKENLLKITTEIDYGTKIYTCYNKDKSFFFQIENSLVNIRYITGETIEELFCQKNEIKDFKAFSLSDFEQLKLNKKKINPLSNNIETAETTIELE